MGKQQEFVSKATAYVGYKGKTFMDWYGMNDEWCAMFVCYVANQVGILGKVIYRDAGAGAIPKEGVSLGYGKWIKKGGGNPQAGDLILFEPYLSSGQIRSSEYMSSHIGIVEKISGTTVYTIEGNTVSNDRNSSVVSRQSYGFSNSRINGYFRPNWSKVDGTSATTPTPATTAATPDIYYMVRYSGSNAFLPQVKNTADYAGVIGKSITDIAIKVSSGTVKYRVHIKGGAWLPYVTGYNANDGNNGYAGDKKIIDALEVIYTSPSGTAFKCAYKISPVSKAYYPEQVNNLKSSGMDGYAGSFGVAMDRLQMRIIK